MSPRDIGRRAARGLVAAVIVAASASSASAQATLKTPDDASPNAAASQSPPTPPRPSRWRLTFRGGGLLPGGASGGVGALPAPGIPINFVGFGTHAVPSWFFGDGASILNTAMAPVGHALTPIDSVLTSPSISRQRGGAFGIAVTRSLSPRYSLEFALDGSATAPSLTPAARSTLEASRASFVDAFTTFFAMRQGAVTSPTTSATLNVTQGGRWEWTFTGAVDVTLHRTARSEWHAIAGLGIVADPGGSAGATLLGHYTFVATPVLPAYDETDAVTISSRRQTRPVVLFGGGWSHDLSRRWGVAADARVTLSGVGETTSVATNPKRVLQPSGQGLILIFTQSPAIVFSNVGNPASSLATTLSPTTSFVATGVQLRAELTAGLFLRF